MPSETKLIFVKVIHTLVWFGFNIVIFKMLYAVMANIIGPGLWIGYGLVLAEGLVLLAFKGMCPLTIVAKKYSDSTKDNFDIYLPNWLARHNKLIYICLLIIISMITVYRLLAK